MKDLCGHTETKDDTGALVCDRGEGHPGSHWDDNKNEYF